MGLSRARLLGTHLELALSNRLYPLVLCLAACAPVGRAADTETQSSSDSAKSDNTHVTNTNTNTDTDTDTSTDTDTNTNPDPNNTSCEISTAPVVDNGAYVDMCPFCDAHAICDGAYAWYRFDEQSGTVAYDSTGNGHDGSYNNGIQLKSTGASMTSCSAIAFDSTGGSATFGAGTNSDFDKGAFSAEFWMKLGKLPDGSGEPVLLSKRQGCNCFNFWEIDVGNGQNVGSSTLPSVRGTISVEMAQGGGNSASCLANATCSGKTEIDDGTWHYVAIVHSTGPSAISIYVDGAIDNSCSAPDNMYDPVAVFTAGTGPCASVDDRKTLASSNMDELAVYSKPLTGAQINSHYKSGLACEPTIW